MSTTLDGTDFREADRGVYVPGVDATRETAQVDGQAFHEADDGVWVAALETHAPALSRAFIADSADRSRALRPRRIAQGDTPDAIRVAARDIAGRPVSIGLGWRCTSRVLDARGNDVTESREIIETAIAGGVTCFVAKLTGDESDLMAPNDFAEYRWLVEIRNADRTFVDTVTTLLVSVAD